MRRNVVANQMLYVRVGEAIRAHRLEARLSAKQLAERCGVTETHLQRVEEGTTACPLHLLVAVADVFDLSLDEIVLVTVDAA